MTQSGISGENVLVVEDDYFQAMEMKQWLEEAGARVIGPSGDPSEVAKWLDAEEIAGAVVDVNLGQGPDFTIAHELRRRGIPFLLMTGYDCEVMPPELAQQPCLTKPADKRGLIAAIETVRRDNASSSRN